MLDDRKTIWIDVEDTGKSTEKAVLLEVDGEEQWLPRSHIGAVKRERGKIVRIEITEWLAKQIGVET